MKVIDLGDIMKYIQYLSGISKIVLHYFLTKLVGFFQKNATYLLQNINTRTKTDTDTDYTF